jgi:hypothetical protein
VLQLTPCQSFFAKVLREGLPCQSTAGPIGELVPYSVRLSFLFVICRVVYEQAFDGNILPLELALVYPRKTPMGDRMLRCEYDTCFQQLPRHEPTDLCILDESSDGLTAKYVTWMFVQPLFISVSRTAKRIYLRVPVGGCPSVLEELKGL